MKRSASTLMVRKFFERRASSSALLLDYPAELLGICHPGSRRSSSQWEKSKCFSMWSFFSPKGTDELVDLDVTKEISMPKRQIDNEQETLKLLESPIGSFSPSTWAEAGRNLEFLVEQTEDVSLAFGLLDRMAQEPDARTRLNHDWIYLAVQKWLIVYTKQQRQQSRIAPYSKPVPPPLTVWRKIETYEREGVCLECRTFHRIIEGTALARSRKAKSAHLAEAILDRMMTLSKHRHPHLRPSRHTFAAVIASWEATALLSTSRSRIHCEAPARALKVLKRLKTLYDSGWGEEFMPDRNMYRRVMNLFAREGNGAQVEALLEELYEFCAEQDYNKDLIPTSPLFSLVLYAWSKSKDPHAAERATLILDTMLELEQSGKIPGLEVTAFCFNVVMVCWSRQRTEESTQRVQGLFDRLLKFSETDSKKQPIGGSYTVLIQTWCRSDPETAEDWLWHWKKEHDEGKCDMRVDSRLFGMLIGAWCSSKDPKAAERCESLLVYAMEGHFKEWEPTVNVFNITINAFCLRRTVEAAQHGEDLLRKMQDYAKYNTTLRPTIKSFIPVINGWIILNEVERAEKILLEYYESGYKTAREESNLSARKKETRTFNSILQGWKAKASSVDYAADRAETLLLRMAEFGVSPNFASFEYALEGRQRSQSTNNWNRNGSERAKDVLALLDREYKKGGLCDEASYLKLRQAWSLLTI